MDELVAIEYEIELTLAKLLGRPPRSIEELAAIVAARAEREAAQESERAAREARAEASRRAMRRAAVMRSIEPIPVAREMLDVIADDTIERSTPALDAARTWLAERRAKRAKPLLVMLSGVGVGKTVAAAWLVARTGGAYVKMRDLAHLYRAGFGDDAAKFQSLITAKLLVVDELTTERDVDLGRAALHEVVDERGSRDRGLVLIANRTRVELAERYDSRTVDRLRQHATAIDLGGPSMRRGTW